MALTLYILRHAKSGHDDPLADIDRPLNERGRHEAADVAALIAARGYQPERIVCSSSQRTRETLAPLLPVLKANTTIELTRRLYDSNADTLLDLIQEHESVPSVMLIGHNPGLEYLARSLPGSGDVAALSRLQVMFPPASLAVVSFDSSSWSDIGPGRGRLEAFETPAG